MKQAVFMGTFWMLEGKIWTQLDIFVKKKENRYFILLFFSPFSFLYIFAWLVELALVDFLDPDGLLGRDPLEGLGYVHGQLVQTNS